MAVIRLTQSMLSSLKCPQDKRRVEFCDTEAPGLYLLVSDSQSRTFYWRTKVNGKTTHIKLGNPDSLSLEDARDQVRQLKKDKLASGNGVVGKKMEMTLQDLWDEYYDFALSTVPRSAKRLEQLWRIRIMPRFGRKKLTEINLRQIQSFMMDLRKENLSAATADHHGKLLRRMGNMAVKWGYIDVSFAKGVQLYHEFNEVENVLNDDQLQRLLDVLHNDSNRPISLLALFLLSTGARLNEALSAQWKHISVETKLWLVPPENSKSKRPRQIPLTESALQVLEQLPRKESDVYVFTNRTTGKPFVNVFKPWNRLRIKAGVPYLRLHDLRHMYASYCVNSGRTIYEVSKLLGHADTRTTVRYSHLSSSTLLEAANSVSTKLTEMMRQKPEGTAITAGHS